MASDRPDGTSQEFWAAVRKLASDRGLTLEEAYERGAAKTPEALVARTEEVQRFGAMVKELRLSKGLSVEEVATKSGVDIETIEALERGRNTDPYTWESIALAEALGTSASAIFLQIEEAAQ